MRLLTMLCFISIFLFNTGLLFSAEKIPGQETGLLTQTPLRSTRAPIHGDSVDFKHEMGIPLGPDRIEAFIQSYMASKKIPGLSAVVIKNGKFVFKKAFGYMDLDLPEPTQTDHLFMLASVTKTITATALMQLYEEGFFQLDDAVNDYLPFAVNHPTHPTEAITFLMLLTHTSAIKDNWSQMPYFPGDSPIPLGDYLEDYLTPGGAYYDAQKNFYTWQPGVQYAYCNIAVALAGYLVETISGLPLEDYCQVNLFPRLQMTETSYFLANLDPSHVAMPYFWNGVKYVAYGHYGYSDYPSGQVRTSAPQLSHFMLSYMQGGYYEGEQVLLPSTVELMLSPQIPAIDPVQGLIWYKWNLNGRVLWGHNGGDQGVTTDMYFWPEADTGVIVFSNGEAGHYQIIEKLFQFSEKY